MGFELFVQAVRNGKKFFYPRRIAIEIFNRGALDPSDPSEPLYGVEYDDGRAEIYGAEEDPMDGIMLAHFGGRTVMERVFELAVATGSLIFWPGEPPWAVPDLALIDHLSAQDEASAKDENLFVVVSNVDELIDLIKASR